MSKVMIIGCGGVASVAIHKCCQNSEVFSEIMIASRTLSKCDALKEKLAPTTKTIITTAKVDADCTEELIALIKQYQPDAVLNLALPYQDLTIMDACLACKVPYICFANYYKFSLYLQAFRLSVFLIPKFSYFKMIPLFNTSIFIPQSLILVKIFYIW